MSETFKTINKATKPIFDEIIENIPTGVKEFTNELKTSINNDINHLGEIMSVELSKVVKGERINLSKHVVSKNVTKFCVGLNWNSKVNYNVDCDVSVVVLDSESRVLPQPEGFVFYENLNASGIKHYGDNTDGVDGALPTTNGNDEQIDIDLDNVDARAEHIIVIASTHSEDSNGTPLEPRLFGQVGAPVMTLFDNTNNISPKPLFEFELDEESSTATAVEVAELYKKNGTWRYVCKGDYVGNTAFGLKTITEKYSI